jgi:parvulin-like peptidyl-prolyl isomerase
VDAADLAREYRENLRAFVHPDVIHVLDAQIVCCPKERAPCVNDPENERCLEAAHADAAKAFAAIAAAADDERARADAQAALAGAFGAAVTDYKLAYDYDRPADQQGGKWVIIDRAIVEALRNAQVGQSVGPVKSEFGYHSLRVLSRKPKRQAELEDPSTQAELRERVCRRLVAAARVRYLGKLVDEVAPQWEPRDMDAVRALVGAGPTAP